MAAAKKTTAAKKVVADEPVEAVEAEAVVAEETPEAVEPEVVEEAPVVEPVVEEAPKDATQSPEEILIADLKAQIKYWEQVIKDKK